MSEVPLYLPLFLRSGVHNVLLELIIAVALRDEPAAAVQVRRSNRSEYF